MNGLNREAQVLGQKLSKTNDQERLAAYVGAAFAYIEVNRNEVSGLNKGAIGMKAHDIFYEVNEVAVIDKDRFIDTAKKCMEFLNRPMVSDGIIMNFDDVNGVNHIFGSAMVEAINTHIDIFRETRMAAKAAFIAE